jgi:hypothetical protein
MHYNIYDVYYSQFSHWNMLLRKVTGSKTSRDMRFISCDKKAGNKAVFRGDCRMKV